jgi:hypothetical protein
LEIKLYKHYNWEPYWIATPPGVLATAPPIPVEPEENGTAEEDLDSHLRSVKEVKGYHIQALDGEIGHVEDFVTDDENWVLRYMVVDTKNWLPGKMVLVHPDWITKVSWEDSKVFVDLSRETIKDSPEFDPAAPVNRAYEERLYDYYGRPKYWR